MAIASLVLGIIAVVFSWFPVVNVISIILGLIGLILGIVGIKRGDKKGAAIAGLILSIIGLVLAVVFLLYVGTATISFLNSPEGQQMIQELQSALPTIEPTAVP